jgi:hypothetical protein
MAALVYAKYLSEDPRSTVVPKSQVIAHSVKEPSRFHYRGDFGGCVTPSTNSGAKNRESHSSETPDDPKAGDSKGAITMTQTVALVMAARGITWCGE